MSAARGLLAWPARWLAGRTLRGRLVAGLLGTLTLACAAVGVLTYAHLDNVLTGQLDQQLEMASSRYVSCMTPGPGGGPPPGMPPTGPHTMTTSARAQACAQLQNTNTFTALGAPVVTDQQMADNASQLSQSYRADHNGQCTLSAADRAALAALTPGGSPQAITLSSYGPYLVVATRSGEGKYLTGLSMAPVTSALREVAMAEILVFSLALVASGLIGTAWVRGSLRPLRRVAATAARVTELPLASGEVILPDRVPDANPRTEVGQLGAAFNRMLGHVEAALARRAASEDRLRRFAADASHELRTPLAAIRGYAELARRHPGPVPDDIAHALSRVESESARMSVLVDELLLLAQLDAGRPLASEPVDLTRLAIDAASDGRAASPGHRWRLDLPGEPVLVRGDEHRLRQVLANLLANAGRHTPAGTTVTVALGCPAPGVVELSVADDGPGIPPDLLPVLFERFVRGNTGRSRGAGSSGLGLAIVDAVTAAHRGRVSVTSEPGRTRFTITLPRRPG